MSSKDNQEDENSTTDHLDKRSEQQLIKHKDHILELSNDENINDESISDNGSLKKKIGKFRGLSGEQSPSIDSLNNNLDNLNNNLDNFDDNLDDNSNNQQTKSEPFIPPTLLTNLNKDEIDDDKTSSTNESNDNKKQKGRPGRKKGVKLKKLNLDENEDSNSSIRRRSSRLKVLEEKKESSDLTNDTDELNKNEIDKNSQVPLNKVEQLATELNQTVIIENKSDKKKKTKDKKTAKKQDDKHDKSKSRRKSTGNTTTSTKSDSDENDNLDDRPSSTDQQNGLPLNSSLSNLTNQTDSNLNDLKPEKVKSRWRRNSELESGSNELITNNQTKDAQSSENQISINDVFNFNNNADNDNDNNQPINEQSPARPAIEDLANTEPMPEFTVVHDNIYHVEKKKTKLAKEIKKMVCDCILTKEERSRGMMGCGEDCLNRMLMIECGNRCPLDDHCSNKRFLKREYSSVEPFKTLKKGWGLRALEPLQPGQFIMEYIGEVIGPSEFNSRVKKYSREERVHHFFMALRADEIIDATSKGNITRFINHSCDSNAETQKWTVNGDLRIGFFATKFIQIGEEITFDYQFQRYGKEAQKCYCESYKCRGYIGATNVSNEIEIDTELHDDDDEEDKKLKKDKSVSKLKDEFEDLALEEEIAKFKEFDGLRSRQQTLMLARLMVRAEDTPNRLKLIEVIRKTQEQAYIRLLLDYHCLQLLWSWMIELEDMDLKAEIIRLLEFLNIPNKTMLKDSKVLDVIERWSKQKDTEDDQKKPTVNGEVLTNGDVEMETDQISKKVENKEERRLVSEELKTNENKEGEQLISSESEAPKDNQTVKPAEPSTTLKGLNIVKKENKSTQEQQKSKPNISMMASRLLNLWKDLKEVYRIPRLERQKRHEDEREADRKAMESDSKLNNSTILPASLRKNVKRPFDQISSRSFYNNYDTFKQKCQFTNDNNYQNATNEQMNSLTGTANRVSKEEHRAIFNVELMRKDYEEAMRQYKKQVEQLVMQQQINISTGQPIVSANPIILPAPPAPPNINIQNLTSSMNNNISSTISVNNINLNNLLNQPATPSTPSTNTFHYNSKLYSGDDFNSSHTNTPIYNSTNVNDTPSSSSSTTIKYAHQKFYSQDYDYQTAFTHQSQPQQQSKELITYNHLIQPQQQIHQQPQLQQQPETAIQQTEPDESLTQPEKSWNTLFAELTGGLRSNLIELTNACHVLKDQASDTDKPDHLIKCDENEHELSDQERRDIDNLFLTPGTYFVSKTEFESKTYFIPSNFMGKEGYEYDQNNMVIESKGDFVVPSRVEANKSDLAENWRSAKDKDGYYYYYNKQTNQLQWNVPLDKESSNGKNSKLISEQSNLDLATLNEILKLSTDSKNETTTNDSNVVRSKSDSTSNDLEEQLNNNLSMELETKIVKFPYQQPTKQVYSERRLKEKFKSNLSEHIKNVLNPYRKHDCKVGRILCNDDFKYLAKKLTHMIMLKELKHCKTAESLTVSEAVKHKTREFVKKYMQKFSPFYTRPDDEEDREEERMDSKRERLSMNSPGFQHNSRPNSLHSAQNSESNSLNTTPTSNNIINNANSELNSELTSELTSELNMELNSELNSKLNSELNSELNSDLNRESNAELNTELKTEPNTEPSTEFNTEQNTVDLDEAL